jgi:aryl-alcohol dehydrogenase-like predicted oxidoreductase
MKTVALGSQGLVVPVEGFGAMGMSAFYGPRDDDESVATLNRAVDLGVTFIDTAEIYGPFLNEQLIAKALGSRRDEIQIATKFGSEVVVGENGPERRALNGSPEYARTALERSLKHLNTDVIDLYYLHRVDPNVPIEDTVGAMAEFVAEGKVRYIGLSEAAPDTIRRAHAVHPITALQTEYSLFEREPEANGVLDTVRELGIGFVAYSPLGRGFLSGQIRSVADFPDDDFRKNLPRFSEENIQGNLRVVDRLTELAESEGVTPSQLALAWLFAQNVVPIPGTKRRTFLEENAAAAEIVLTPEELQSIEDVAPRGAAAGTRYDAAGMASTYR